MKDEEGVIFGSLMSLDKLFGLFIREQEIRGRAEIIIKSYKSSFRCFRKLMPQIDISEFNENTILEFVNKLQKVRIRNTEINDYIKINSDLILNFMNYLWSFFIWIIKNNTNVLHEFSDNSQNRNEFRLMLKFISEYREKCEDLFESTNMDDNPNMRLNSELLIKQLNRRFNSFFNLNDPEFFRAVADYINFIIKSKQLMDIIKTEIRAKERMDISEMHFSNNNDLEYREYLYQNSEWGSWFNLELVYLLTYRIKDLVVHFSANNDIQYFLKRMYCELFSILKDCCSNEKHYFKRYIYNIDLIKIHNYLLEVLEKSIDYTASFNEIRQSVIYKFNEYGIPCGELKISGYNTLYFVKNPAVVIQYFYLNRERNEYFSYHGYNEFRGANHKHLTSNLFRLLIEGINKRVCSLTSNMVKFLIIKKKKNSIGKEINYYKFNSEI